MDNLYPNELENGLMKLEVIEKEKNFVNCKIITGGICSHYYCPNSSNHNSFLYCICSSNYALTPQNK